MGEFSLSEWIVWSSGQVIFFYYCSIFHTIKGVAIHYVRILFPQLERREVLLLDIFDLQTNC